MWRIILNGFKILTMKKQPLVLKFEEENNEYIFDNKINVIENKKLVENLEKENIKNENSSLIFKSMNNLAIYDVIQLKINLSDTGVFLVNFEKDKLTEETRKNLIEQISKLKDNVEPSFTTQINKIKKLINILNKYNPIYITFLNDGDIKIGLVNLNKMFAKTPLKFPILILEKKQKNTKTHVIKLPKLRKNKTIKNNKSKKNKEIVIKFPLFSVDYLFATIFAALLSFGIFAGIFGVITNEVISTFLFIVSTLFFGVECYVMYSCIYTKHIEQFKGLKYWLCLYLLVGLAFGTLISFLVCKFSLTGELPVDYMLIFEIATPVTIALLIITIFVAKLINYLTPKVIKK